MRLVATEIPEVLVVEPLRHDDERGWFVESYHERDFHVALRELGHAVPGPFVQDYHSCSRRGVLRGLHYQLPPHAQGKLVRVVRGSAFDVAVDLRPGSRTFRRWVGVVLDSRALRQLWIPPGFAHGFLALEDDTHFLGKTTAFYSAPHERAIAWNDPAIGIAWPLAQGLPVLSSRDRAAPPLGRPARDGGPT